MRVVIIHDQNLWSDIPTVFQKDFAEPLRANFIIYAFFWYVHRAPSGPSWTLYDQRDRDVFPLTMISGGIFWPAALMQGRKVTVSRLLDVLPGTVLAPFLATTFAGLCSKHMFVSSMFQIEVGGNEATSTCKSLKYAPTTVGFMALDRVVDNFSGRLSVSAGCLDLRPAHHAFPGTPFVKLFRKPIVLHKVPVRAIIVLLDKPNP